MQNKPHYLKSKIIITLLVKQHVRLHLIIIIFLKVGYMGELIKKQKKCKGSFLEKYVHASKGC